MVASVRLGQSINRSKDGTFNRVYKITLEFEDAEKLREKLGIEFDRLCEVFSNKFVPLLMTETLKQVKRSTELELAAPKKPNVKDDTELKKILANATAAVRVAKGSSKKGTVNDEDVMELNPEKTNADEHQPRRGKKKSKQQDSDNDDSNEDEDDDEAGEKEMDIDGPKKRKMTNYDNEDSDEIMMDHDSANVAGDDG